MASEWATANDLARLPAMPTTASAVIRRAKRDGWFSRPRKGRGGAREYATSSLPTETQQALRARQATQVAQHALDSGDAATASGQAFGERIQHQKAATDAERQRAKEDGIRRFAALAADSPKRQRAKARELVLQGLWGLQRAQGVDLRTAMHLYAEQANAGELSLPHWAWQWMPRYHGRRAITAGSLRNWHYAYTQRGIWALTDGYGARRGQNKIEASPELKRVVLGVMMRAPHITSKKVKAYVAAEHPELDTCSEAAYRRFMMGWKSENAQLWTYATNPDRWKSVYMAAYGSQHEQIERLNQLWELDSTPGDWLLADGRHSVIGVIDLYSRRLRLLVSRTSTANAICSVFRSAVLDWGVPETVRTDNGSDYTSEQVDQVLRAFEIHQELCLPFASEQKGTIERALQTMSHGLLDLLPGFVGHSVAERKVIEARKSFARRVMTPGETVEVSLTAAELQEKLDAWTEHVYQHDAHEGLGGRTPFQAATSWREPVRRVGDERALDALLAPLAGERTVAKKGIRFEGRHYVHAELAMHAGRQVRLRRDESDIGRLYVYSLAGEFFCIAECPEITGISQQEAATAAKRAQKRFMANQAEELRRHKRATRDDIASVVLEHRISQSEKLTAFPGGADDYTTAGLEEAGRAARAGDAPETPERDAETTEAVEQLKREMAQPAPVHSIDDDDPRRKYERWVRLDRRIQRGEPVTERERAFHRGYPRTTDYRSMADHYADFGLRVSDEQAG